MTHSSDFLDLFSLKDQVAIVTGASGGIGEVAAMTLAALGANVAICSRSIAHLNPVRDRIAERGRAATAFECDIRSLESIEDMVSAVEKQMGPISILVNNAGIDIPQAAADVTEEAWDNIIDTNLKGMFFCSQKVGYHMIRRRQGQIINLASELSFIASAPYSVYAISKGGVAQLTRALAVEWAPYNIRVNAVAPTLIATQMLEDLFRDNANSLGAWVSQIPLGRVGQPQDVANAIAFLASAASQFITGTVLPVDGGRLAG